MPQTETLTETIEITLPASLVKSIRARAREAGLHSANELILQDLLKADDWTHLPDAPLGPPLDEWLEKEIPARIARLESGEDKAIPMEEVFAKFKQRREARKA